MTNLEVPNHFERTVCIFSFNRPKYLKQLLESIKKNNLDNVQFLLFQDGNYDVMRRKNVATRDQITSCMKLFEDANLPNSKIFLTSNCFNYGIAIMQREAKRIIFDNSNIEFAFLFEDDFIIVENYFELIDSLRNEYENDERAFSVQAFSNMKLNSEEMERYKNELVVTDAHHWGWAVWKRSWDKIKNDFDLYYEFIKNVSYNDLRRHIYTDQIYDIFRQIYPEIPKKSKHFSLPVSQDGAKALCMNKNGMYQISTKLNYIKPIGEYGLNFKPVLFKKYRLDQIEIPKEAFIPEKWEFEGKSMQLFDNFVERKTKNKDK